jgi:hypothetical protein
MRLTCERLQVSLVLIDRKAMQAQLMGFGVFSLVV